MPLAGAGTCRWRLPAATAKVARRSCNESGIEYINFLMLPMVVWGIKALPVWMAVLYLYNNVGAPLPERNGSRTWQAFRNVYGACDAAEHYFSLKIWRSSVLPETRQYMFAFHPHGIYPLTIYWSTQGNRWKNLFPNINIVPLCATVIFRLPLMRDICLWLGIQDGTQFSFFCISKLF